MLIRMARMLRYLYLPRRLTRVTYRHDRVEKVAASESLPRRTKPSFEMTLAIHLGSKSLAIQTITGQSRTLAVITARIAKRAQECTEVMSELMDLSGQG